MRSRLCSLVVVGLAVMAVGSAVGQDPDARTLLQTSLKAMGGENMRSIRYSASTGYVGQVGQNYSPANDWPTNTLTSYTRTIDYEGKSSKEDLTMKQGTGQGGPIGGGNAPVITNPFEGEQRRTSMVSGNYAWNMQGTTIVPAPADAEQRQLGSGSRRTAALKRLWLREPIPSPSNAENKAKAASEPSLSWRLENTGCSVGSTTETWSNGSRRGSPVPSSETCITNWCSRTIRISVV